MQLVDIKTHNKRNDVLVYSDQNLAVNIESLDRKLEQQEEEDKEIDLDNPKGDGDMEGKIVVAKNHTDEDVDPIGFDDDTAFAEMKDYNHMDDIANRDQNQNQNQIVKEDPSRPDTAIQETI